MCPEQSLHKKLKSVRDVCVWGGGVILVMGRSCIHRSESMYAFVLARLHGWNGKASDTIRNI